MHHGFESEAVWPLTSAQERLWFLWRLDPVNPTYNLSTAWRCRGWLDAEGLQWALQEVVRRHDALRMVFREQDGVSMQTPQTGFEFTLLRVNLDEERLEAFCREQYELPFDLEQSPAVRGVLVRLGEKEHVLILTFHHIIADGWSLGIVLKETMRFYSDYVQGRSTAMLPVRSFGEIASEHRQQNSGEHPEEHIAYWRRQLETAGSFHLNTDPPRREAASTNGGKIPLLLSQQTQQRANRLAREEGATLFMVLLTAFHLVLARWAGQEQAVTGTPVADREHEDVVGFLIDTVVLRSDLSGELSGREALRRMRQLCLDAFGLRKIPFEKLVQVVKPERHLNRNPLYQIMFALQNAPMPMIQVPGLRFEGLNIIGSVSELDLSVSIWEDVNGLAGYISYNAAIFDQATVFALGQHFGRLLEALLTDPDALVSGLGMLSAAEEQTILSLSGSGGSSPLIAVPAYVLFEEQVERTPNAEAVRFGERYMTYRDLNQRANRNAVRLRRAGVGKEVMVGLTMDRSFEMIIAVLAIMKAGAACVPLAPDAPHARNEYIIADAGISLVLCRPGQKASFRRVVQIEIDNSGDEPAEDEPCSIPDLDNPCYVIYTSGSTGRPKGVVMTHRAFGNLIRWQNRDQEVSLTTLQFAPLIFDVSFQEIFTTLSSGGTLCMVSEEDRRDLDGLCGLCARLGVQRLFLPFVALQQLAESQEKVIQTQHALKEVITAGEQLQITPALRSFFSNDGGPVLLNHYGPSETHVVTSHKLGSDSGQWPLLPPIGLPISDCRAYVLDAGFRLTQLGQPGELYIGGQAVARGYLNASALTAERFVPDPFSVVGGDRLYRTGDSARWTPSGELEFLGRLDDQVKIRGFRIEMGEIEAVLRSHPCVQDAAVIVQELFSGAKRLIAYFVGSTQDPPSTDDLKAHLGRLLPDYMVPALFVALPKLPLTASGKVSRRDLEELPTALSREMSNAPMSRLEERLCSLFASSLNIEHVGRGENLFDLGLDSLLCLRVVARARRQNLQIRIQDIFRSQTVAGLSQHVKQLELTALTRTYGGGWVPLTSAQEGLWLLYRLQPMSAFYNIGAAMRLLGSLQVQVLEQSLNKVIGRHGVLRSSFREIAGQPMQRVEKWSGMTLEPVSLERTTLGTPEDFEDAVLAAARNELARPFRLEEAPPFRVCLFATGPEQHVLVASIHHIVADGWSVELLLRETAQFYAAFLLNRKDELVVPTIEYADYAAWQRKLVETDEFREQVRAYATVLGACEELRLPADFQPSAARSHIGQTKTFPLNSAVCAGLRALARPSGATLHVVLLSLFGLLLHRYGGQTRFALGVPISGRDREELEPVIGLLINTVAVVLDLSHNPTIFELIGRTRTAMIEALTCRDVPFEKVTEQIHIEHPERESLFKVLFSSRGRDIAPIQFPGLAAEYLPLELGIAKFDLSVDAVELGDTVQIAVEFSTGRFRESTIIQMIDHFEKVLRFAISGPERRISSFQLQSEETARVSNMMRRAARPDLARWASEA